LILSFEFTTLSFNPSGISPHRIPGKELKFIYLFGIHVRYAGVELLEFSAFLSAKMGGRLLASSFISRELIYAVIQYWYCR
jgi:hypothetical protein